MMYYNCIVFITGFCAFWRFAAATEASCSDNDFPLNLTGKQYLNLSPAASNITTYEACRQACCDMGASCKIYQFNTDPSKKPDCWLGASTIFIDGQGYVSGGRNMPPPPTPPKSPYTVNDASLGLRWEGIGAISGGGATTKLLMDYDEKISSEILRIQRRQT